jgi:peptidoglycan hydrolase-like protein with peptidoglycan-binding domain
MNEKELLILWKFMKKGDPDYPDWKPVPNFPDYQTFKNKMSTPELRNKFYVRQYPALVKGRFFSNDWTADDFEKEYGPQNATTPPNPKTTSAPTKEEICSGKLVSEGMKGDVVWMINDKLKKINFFNKELTNDFGKETKKAVANFQNSNKDKLEDKLNPKARVVDGIVGPKTWNLLFQGTEHACKTTPTNTTTTSAKPTDTTSIPTKPEVKPDEVKPIKFLKAVSPKVYTGRIGEQVTGLNKPNFNSQSNFNFNNPKYATPTKQKTEDPVQILKRVINTGCINSLKKEIGFELYDNPESQPTEFEDGSYAITGVNLTKREQIYLFPNFTGERVKVDNKNQPIAGQTEKFKWQCDSLKKTESKTADITQMSEDQAEYVNKMVTRGKIQTTKPSDYETNQGKWKWIDLHDMNPGLFTKEKEYFVYSQSGLMGKLKNQYPNVEKVINQTGWTLDQPDIDTEAYSTRRDIGVQFPKYTELFPNGLPIYYTGTTRSTKEQQIVSDLVKAIGTNTDSIDGKTCRDSVNVLYDALQNWKNGVRYFSGDTELELVRAYVQRCRKNYENGFNRIFAGGAKKKYDFLNRRRSGPSGELQFMIGEQKNNLNSLIKKKLFEAKAKKENNTLEKQLIENKLKTIVKSVKREGNILKK